MSDYCSLLQNTLLNNIFSIYSSSKKEQNKENLKLNSVFLQNEWNMNENFYIPYFQISEN